MTDPLEKFYNSTDGGSLFARQADAILEANADAAQGRPRPALAEQFLGVIRFSSCGNYSSIPNTDARYYIDRATIGDLGESELVSASADKIPGIQQCLIATNLAEVATQTHLLPVGTLVQVLGFYSRSSPPSKLYVFNAPPGPGVVVEITGAATGNGEYNGRILGSASNASPATALTMPAGMTIPSTDNALVLNTEESSLPGNRLLTNSYAIGCAVGLTTESTPRTIVMVRGGVGVTTSPTTLGNGTVGSISADTASWNKSTTATPLSIWVQTRTFWDNTGNVLYAYLRQLTFDARGLLVSASAETQITVDVTQACP